MQSSVNQIASVFRGNPAPLQQRVNQDKQANQGIPADLKELLALQILTEERDSMSRQQAIQQLQQASQQPTVAQSLQQRAQQAIQSKAVQEQQNQQGLQGLMQQLGGGAVPENIPQPQRQPQSQGIAQLPTGMDEFSGGGIVAFEEGGSVEEKYRREFEEMGEGTRMKFSPEVQEYAKRLRGNQRSADDEYADRERQLMLSRSREFASGRPAPERNPNITREVMNRVGPMGAPKFMDPRRADAGQGLPSALAAESPAPAAPPIDAPVRPPAVRTPAAPAIPAAPVISATPPAGGLGDLITPDVTKKRQQLMIDAMNRDPATEERLRREAYETQVGAPQTAGLEQLAQELQDRRAKMQERNRKIDPLVENLTAIANAPRGQKWMYSMLAGSSAVKKAQQDRENQDFEMLKQIVEQQNKIEDVKRGYRAETFTIGDKERNRVYKDAFEAAKELGADDREATKLAQDAVLKREQMENSLKIANIGQTRELNEQARINKITSLKQQARRLESTDPEAAAELMAQAADLEASVGRGSGTAGVGADNAQTRKLRDAVKDIDSRLELMDPKSPEFVTLQAQRDRLSKMIVERAIGEAGVAPASAPKIGEVQQGYRFKGGNPADQSSWEKVK
jgi:hypothetical protein